MPTGTGATTWSMACFDGPSMSLACANSQAIVPCMAVAAPRHTAPVNWRLGWGFPMVNARTWISPSRPSSHSPAAARDKIAILGVPRTSPAACVSTAKPNRTAPSRRISSTSERNVASFGSAGHDEWCSSRGMGMEAASTSTNGLAISTRLTRT